MAKNKENCVLCGCFCGNETPIGGATFYQKQGMICNTCFENLRDTRKICCYNCWLVDLHIKNGNGGLSAGFCCKECGIGWL